jgi:hypothetical protein
MRSRHFQRAGLTLGAILAAVLFFMGGVALRLLMGPISLGPFASTIEDSVNRSLIGLVIRFDQAVLEWSRRDGQINLIISGTNVFDATGRIVAQAPRSDLDFDVASLLAGEFALKRFTLLGVQLTAVRDAQGALKLGFGQADSDVDLFEMIRNTLDGEGSGSSPLETFSIQDARLAFRDESTGLFIVAPHANFSVGRNQDQFEASFDADIELSGVPAQLSALAIVDDNGVPRGGSLSVTGLDLVALAANSEAFSSLAPYALTTNLVSEFELGPQGQLAGVYFSLDGAGNVAPPELDRPLQIDMFEIQGRYETEIGRLNVENARIESPHGSAAVRGWLDFGWNEGVLASLDADLEAENIALNLPDVFGEPVALSAASVAAAYEEATKTITWRRLALEGDALNAEFEGTTSFPEDMTPAIYVTGSIDRLAVEDLLRVWPTDLAGGARSWMADNIFEGFIGPLGLATDIGPGMLSQDALPEEALALVFPVDGVTANYMTGLTLMTELKGDALLSGNTFQMSVSEANIGPLSASAGEVFIPNLHTSDPPGDIRAIVSGSTADVLTLIDMEPLGYPTRFNVEPADVDGQAEVGLDLTIPMRRDLDVDDVRIAITVNATGLGMQLSETRTLSNARAQYFVDNDHLTGEGTGDLNGVPLMFTWEENFSSGDYYSTRVGVRGTLDEGGRERLRLVTPDWMSGPIAVSATFLGNEFDFESAEVRADLTAAQADIDLINFVKEPGERVSGVGKIDFLDGGAVTISDMHIEGLGTEILGEFALDDAGRLISASFPIVRFGENSNFGLELDAPNEQIPSWRLYGHAMDATRIFFDDDPVEGDGAVEDGDEVETVDAANVVEQDIAPISLDLELETVAVREGVALRDVAFRYVIEENERLTDFHLDAMGPGDGTIVGRFGEEDTIRTLTISSDQAGDFVEAFTGFPSLRDGEILVEASFRPDTIGAAPNSEEDYGGTIRITDFSVVDQPFMARLFSIGSLDGPLRLLQNEGIPFAEMEAPFKARGGQVNLVQGRASGVAMGVSFEGVIDRDNDTIDVNGSLVPVFGLNNMLGAIPVIGDLLVSQEWEGIFGLTYQATGDINEPQVVVNPLSVLTPGILRRIFEFGGPPEQFGATAAVPAQAVSGGAVDFTPVQTE